MSKQYAIITLVMKGDGFIPGALVLGQSLRNVKTAESLIDTICMVTEDVSETAREMLKEVYDRVEQVEYITAEATVQLGHEKNPGQTDINLQRYKTWIQSGFTKYQALQFTEYEKILFLDADMRVSKNIDHLFDLPTPAGNFGSIPMYFAHGQRIPKVFLDKYVFEHPIRGCTWMVKPTKYDFEGLLHLVKNYDTLVRPVWTRGGSLEIILTLWYWKEWTQIHKGYSASYSDIRDSRIPKNEWFISDFIGDNKPWDSKLTLEETKDWSDFTSWDTAMLELLQEYPNWINSIYFMLSEDARLRKIIHRAFPEFRPKSKRVITLQTLNTTNITPRNVDMTGIKDASIRDTIITRLSKDNTVFNHIYPTAYIYDTNRTIVIPENIKVIFQSGFYTKDNRTSYKVKSIKVEDKLNILQNPSDNFVIYDNFTVAYDCLIQFTDDDDLPEDLETEMVTINKDTTYKYIYLSKFLEWVASKRKPHEVMIYYLKGIRLQGSSVAIDFTERDKNVREVYNTLKEVYFFLTGSVLEPGKM